MIIRVTNSIFESANAGEFETVDDAYRAALQSGLKIAAEEVATGKPSAIVQVAVDVVGRRAARRGSVAVSTADLLSTDSD